MSPARGENTVEFGSAPRAAAAAMWLLPSVSKNGQQIHTYINNKKVRSGGHRVVSVLRGKEAGTLVALWGPRPPALYPAPGRRMA